MSRDFLIYEIIRSLEKRNIEIPLYNMDKTVEDEEKENARGELQGKI